MCRAQSDIIAQSASLHRKRRVVNATRASSSRVWRWICEALNSAADLRLGLPAVSTWMRPVPADAGLPRTEPDTAVSTRRESPGSVPVLLTATPLKAGALKLDRCSEPSRHHLSQPAVSKAAR